MEIGSIITFAGQYWLIEDIKRIDSKRDTLILSKDNSSSITDQPCQCSECDWSGTVWDCESDEETGDLLCPECLTVIEVIV